MIIGVDVAIWLALAVFLGIVEIFTVGFFFMFFAIGAAFAAGAALLTGSFIIQTLVFTVSSLLLVMFARPLLKETFNIGDKPAQESNTAALIGTEVLVLEDVDKYRGKVKVIHTGETWTAYMAPPRENETLPAGTPGRIVFIDGAKLAVEPMPEV